MKPIHLSSFLTHSTSALLSHINHLSGSYAGKGHTILFALSANFPNDGDLEEVVGRLTRFNDVKAKTLGNKSDVESAGHTIGCLTDPFPSAVLANARAEMSNFTSFAGERTPLSCAIAVLESSRCIPFYSSLPGRTKPQVGRWHSFRKKPQEVETGTGELEFHQDTAGKTDWEEIWNRSSGSSSSIDLLPEALRSHSLSEIHTVLHMSVPQPDLLTQTLSENVPSATTLGLIAAPTHFVTGRGVTLFFDGGIYGEGAVGLALLKDKRAGGVPKQRTEFHGLHKLSSPLTVTSTEGNMINSLDSSNPTQLLLQAIGLNEVSSSGGNTSRTFKEDEEFALGVLAPTGEVIQTYKITAGDPAHRGGSISLDADRAPAEGCVVQFLRRSSNATFQLPSSLTSSTPENSTLAFLAVPEPPSTQSTSETITNTSTETPSLLLSNTFLAPSHGGFVLSHAKEASNSPISIPSDPERPGKVAQVDMWSCSMAGGTAVVEWD